MTPVLSPTIPMDDGYYVAWLAHSARPVLLWWSTRNPQWRSGMQLQQVRAWMGPLPEVRA